MATVAVQFDAAVKVSLAEIQKAFVSSAKAAHAEVMQSDPRPVSFKRHVDGKKAPEETVKPDGVIVYDYDRLDLVAKAALDVLRKRSPVKSGDYVRGHTLCLNGTPVDDLKGWKPGDEVSITNPQPYSRKIESGHMKMSVPPHVYENAMPIIRRQFDNMATVSFEMRAHSWGAKLQGKFSKGRGPSARTGLRKDTKRGAALTYPTLIIREPSALDNGLFSLKSHCRPPERPRQ